MPQVYGERKQQFTIGATRALGKRYGFRAGRFCDICCCMVPDDDNKDETAAAVACEAGAEAAYDEVKARAEARKERTAKALRENLLRRKQQGRARRAGAADETDGLPAAKTRESQD